MAYPTAHRAHLPAGYGLPPDSPRLDWAEVDARLRDAPHYWIGTVGTDGVPTVRPIDGMWLDGALFFGSDPASRWRRNLAVNPRAAVHLEDAERAVIVEGDVTAIRLQYHLAARLAEAANVKYGLGQSVRDYEGQESCMLRPRVVFAWTTLYRDATRFTFGRPPG
jgi:nitroimidazol reductase NimA-like FMN-containing flavoprotein (pyridoxamine 5'-phosphate oxidase superfamily)